MIAGQIQLEAFGYVINDSEGRTIGPDGRPAGEPFPLKLLTFLKGPLSINFLFKPEEFEEFGKKMTGDVIVRAASFTPRIFPDLKFPNP